MNRDPWESYQHIWKTKSSFMSWLRGGIRRSLWNKSPIKIEFIKKNRIRINNPRKTKRSPAKVWGAKCEICDKEYPLKEIQVDHKVGNHSLNDFSDIQSYIMNIVMVEESGLQLICKKCHKIKTYSEKKNISFNDAMREKKVIAYTKLIPKKQIEILSGFSLPNNNAVNRRLSFSKIIDELPDLKD